MASSQTHYALLQVHPTADLDTIKRAYRKKIRRYHPDQFAAELSRVKQDGTPSAIRKLEKEFQAAQQMTQRINAAYAVLSDASQRAAYDQRLSDDRQRKYNDDMRRQRVQHWEGERRTVKSRPHRNNPNMQPKPASEEGIPWFILAGLVGMLLLVSTLFSNAVTQSHTPFTTYVPRNPTSEGSILAADLQATTNSRQATVIARSTIVFDATATPRSSASNEALGDRFYASGIFDRAITAYDDAIEADQDNPILYIKRAIAYTALFETDDEQALESAIEDYSLAIALDATLADAYLGRGLLYYEKWQRYGGFNSEARRDLEQYLALTDHTDIADVQAILERLP